MGHVSQGIHRIESQRGCASSRVNRISRNPAALLRLQSPATWLVTVGFLSLVLATACGDPGPEAKLDSPATEAADATKIVSEETTPTGPTVAETEIPAATSTASPVPPPTTEQESISAPDQPREIRLQTTEQLTFDSADIKVDPGESLTFVIENPSAFPHTFTIAISTSKLEILVDVPVGLGLTETTTVQFPDEPAVLYLFCRPHEAAGMVGRVQVGNGALASQAPQGQDTLTPASEDAGAEPADVASPSPTSMAKVARAEAELSEDGSVQRVSVTENIFPRYFEPSEIVVRVGIPVELELSTKQAEHVNQVSILPWVTSSAVVLPGRPITIRFTPDKVGEFKIRNIGHGFAGKVVVVE